PHLAGAMAAPRCCRRRITCDGTGRSFETCKVRLSAYTNGGDAERGPVCTRSKFRIPARTQVPGWPVHKGQAWPGHRGDVPRHMARTQGPYRTAQVAVHRGHI